MTTTPTVTAEVIDGQPQRIGVTVTAADVDTASLTRITPAGREPVLGAQGFVVAGAAYVIDHTAPMDVPVQYVATAINDGAASAESAPSAAVTIVSNTTGAWLSDPTIPYSDVLVRIKEWDDRTYDTESTAVVPLGGRVPIALAAPRQVFAANVTFKAYSAEDRAAIRGLFGTAPIIYLRPGVIHDEPARYCLAGKLGERRLTIGKYELDVPLTETLPPPRASVYGAPGMTYDDLSTYYTSYDDPALTSRTYIDLAKDPRP